MDKKHTNTASQLADRGWADMQHTLDREMPQNRRRRPFFWIFWGAAALMGAGMAAWWLWTGSATVAPAIPKDKELVSQQPIAGVKEQPQTRIGASVPAPEPAGTVTLPTGLTKTVTPKASADTRQADLTAVNSTSKILSPDNFADSDNSLSTKTTKPPTTDYNAQTPSTGFVFAEPGSPYQTQAILPLSLLPTSFRVIGIIRNPKSKIRPEYPGQSVGRTPGALQYGAYAGLQVNPQSGTLLPSAGLMADWRWSRKFGLRTGIGYQYEYFSSNARPGTIVSEASYLDATGDQRVLENNPGPQSGPVSSSTEMRKVLLPVSAIHRLELPLQVYWQARPRWRAYAGVHMQYAFRAQSTGSVVELDSSRVLSGVNPAFTSRLASEQTRTWTSFASFGAGYQLSRHLEIALHCRLSPSLKSANQMDFDNMDTSNSGQFNSTADRIHTSITTPSHFQLQMTWKF